MAAQILLATLMHSFWQGLILAGLAFVIVMTTRKAPAVLRYNLLVGCLALFVAGVCYTAYLQAGAVQVTQVYSSVLPFTQQYDQETLQLVNNAVHAPGIAGWWNTLLGYLNQYAVMITWAWFLVICVRSIYLLIGLHQVHRIRHTQILSAGHYWEERAAELANQLGIRKAVKIVQSGIALMPMVAGHFKPVILIPVGMLSGLPVAEAEAILIHELAHIVRKDYLVNILQSFLEILFFFNPAVKWVSELIRAEREHCCDDLSVARLPDKADYIRALLSCQENKWHTPELAVAFASRNKHQLLNRVTRMLNKQNTSFNRSEKTIASVIMVSFLLLMAVFTGSDSFSQKSSRMHRNSVSKDSIARHYISTAPAVFTDSDMVLPEEPAIPFEITAVPEPPEPPEPADIPEPSEPPAPPEPPAPAAPPAPLVNPTPRHVYEQQKKILDEQQRVLAEQKYRFEEDRRALEEQRRALADAQYALEQQKLLLRSEMLKTKQYAVDSCKAAIQACVKTTPAKRELRVKAGSTDQNSLKINITDEILRELKIEGLIPELANGNFSFKLDEDGLEINGRRLENVIGERFRKKFVDKKGKKVLYKYSVDNTESSTP